MVSPYITCPGCCEEERPSFLEWYAKRKISFFKSTLPLNYHRDKAKESIVLASIRFHNLKLHSKLNIWDRDVAQWVIVFAVKEQDPSSSPQPPNQKLDKAACTCNHQHDDSETADLLTAHQPVSLAEMARF